MFGVICESRHLKIQANINTITSDNGGEQTLYWKKGKKTSEIVFDVFK